MGKVFPISVGIEGGYCNLFTGNFCKYTCRGVTAALKSGENQTFDDGGDADIFIVKL
ncbi:MAG: hypothetical protein MUO27_00320 [Sedimentisphaerales bacterium]|nr:hypothetical protein [Sedimentisphaerales bacterium]